jgi:hypothetical protein
MEQKTIITNRKYIIYKKDANNTIIFTSRPDRHKNEILINNPNYKK